MLTTSELAVGTHHRNDDIADAGDISSLFAPGSLLVPIDVVPFEEVHVTSMPLPLQSNIAKEKMTPPKNKPRKRNLKRPSTTSTLMLPRLEPQISDYQRPMTALQTGTETKDSPKRRAVTTGGGQGRDEGKYGRGKRNGGGKRQQQKKEREKLTTIGNTRNKRQQTKRRPRTAPDPGRRKKGSIGTVSGMLIDRSPASNYRRPQTSIGSPARRRQGLARQKEKIPKMCQKGLTLRHEDVQRYKRMLSVDVFAPRTKMLTKRMDLTFRARGPSFNIGTLVPIQESDADTPRLLACLRELSDLVGMSSTVASQLIESGIVSLVSSAAWLFGSVEKSVERNISEAASLLLRDLCRASGHANHLITRTEIVSALGAIIMSGIGATWYDRRQHADGSEPSVVSLKKRTNIGDDLSSHETTTESDDLASTMRCTAAWSSLRPYAPSYTDQFLPADHISSPIIDCLRHTSRQVWLAVQALGALSSTTEQHYLRSGDGQGWRRFVEAGGLEFLILAGADGSKATDSMPQGKLDAMCTQWLNTGKCQRHSCPLMHVTGVYSTLVGVTTAGDVYLPETAFPSAQLERVRLSHQLLRTQFTVEDFDVLRRVRHTRVSSSTNSTVKTLSARATLLHSQVSLRDPSAALSLRKFGGTISPHTSPTRTYATQKGDPLLSPMLLPTTAVVGSPVKSPTMSATYSSLRHKSRDTGSLLSLHVQRALVGSKLIREVVPHTLRQHLEWLRRAAEREKRLAIEAIEWRIIRQQRIKQRIQRMCDAVRRAARRDPHEQRLVGELLNVFAVCCLKFVLCPQRANAEVTRSSSSSKSSRTSSRTDKPHMWTRATSKSPAQCHHCHTDAVDLALESREDRRNFLTATALGLRFRRWLSDVPLAFLRMNLPELHQQWINDCQQNNSKDCGIAGFRLSKHPWFSKYCGAMMRSPKGMQTLLSIERIDIIEVGSPIRKLSGSKEMQRKKKLVMPRGIDPSRWGWPGLSLQN